MHFVKNSLSERQSRAYFGGNAKPQVRSVSAALRLSKPHGSFHTVFFKKHNPITHKHRDVIFALVDGMNSSCSGRPTNQIGLGFCLRSKRSRLACMWSRLECFSGTCRIVVKCRGFRPTEPLCRSSRHLKPQNVIRPSFTCTYAKAFIADPRPATRAPCCLFKWPNRLVYGLRLYLLVFSPH